MKAILKKLNRIQVELKAPKGQMNKFGNYKYRSCEDILESIKPLLDEVKCIIAVSDKINLVGERYYVEATATIYDCETAESFSTTASAREEENKKGMDSSQVTGATSSYSRKYALNGLLAIDDTKDSDSTNTHGKDTQVDIPEKEKVDTHAKITKVYIDTINKTLKDTNSDVESFLTYMEVEKIEDITMEEFVKKAKPALEAKSKQKK